MGGRDIRRWIAPCGTAAVMVASAEAAPSFPAPFPRRGEIWWVDFDPSQGSEIRKSRPAVVVTADGLNRGRRTVVVVPLSTGPRAQQPIVVEMTSAGNRSVAICDQLRAVDKKRLTRQHGLISAADMQALEAAIRKILQL
jgi:mRNA interferase MazF